MSKITPRMMLNMVLGKMPGIFKADVRSELEDQSEQPTN
jgi:hypothetical protein